MSTPSDPHDRLPDDLRALLREESARVAITDDARTRLATRLAASVVGFGAPSGLSAPPVPRVPSSPAPAPPVAPPPVLPPALAAPALGLGAAGTKIIAAIALSATAIVGGHALFGRASAPAPVSIAAPTVAQAGLLAPAAPVPDVPAVAPVPVASYDVAPVPPVAADSLATRAARSSGVHAPSTAAPMARPVLAPVAAPTALPVAPPAAVVDLDGLREEQAPLDEARRDLDRGDALAALNATRSHAARFPQGALAEARDALRIRALVRLGRTDEARRELAAFRARYPHSLLLGEGDDSSILP